MEIKAHAQTIRTTDVVHVYDGEKNLHWFISFERTNGKWDSNCAREMMNYENFKAMGSDYMTKVYDLAYKHIENITDLSDAKI